MTTVTILSRDKVLEFPEPNRPLTRVAVTYQTQGLPPRTVFLAEDLYAAVAPDTPAAAAGITVEPVDDAAQAQEDEALRKDIAAVESFAPPTREL